MSSNQQQLPAQAQAAVLVKSTFDSANHPEVKG
jgi:hypothetical protein